MVREHGLDNEGRDGLRSLVGEVERSWYGVRADSGRAANPAVPDAFEGVRRSLRRNAPLALRAKLLPRSVLQRSRGRSRVS